MRAMVMRAVRTPQNTFCHLGEWGLLDVEILFITRMPESADVTKKMAIIAMAIALIYFAIGKYSKKVNSKISGLSTNFLKAPLAILVSTQMAPVPKTVIHRNMKSDGINMTASTYSRMVRPLELRAMNSPTKGAQLIHHAQYITVQLVNHPCPAFSKANVLNV